MSEQDAGKKIRSVAARGRKPVARSVLAKLVEDIASGRFAETTLLPSEAELSRRFEVSRTALREAMRHLVALGLIEPRTRAGTVVLPRSRWNRLDPMILAAELRLAPTPEVADQLFEAVFFLMPKAASLAAERASAGEVAALEQALAVARTPAEQRQALVAFHAALFQATGNWVFRQFSTLIDAALAESFQLAEGEEAAFERNAKWLRAILEAIRLRRPDEARTAMKKLVGLRRADLAGATKIHAPKADGKAARSGGAPKREQR